MRDMINWCITVVQGGKALDVNGPDMIAMEAYAFYMYRGQDNRTRLADQADCACRGEIRARFSI